MSRSSTLIRRFRHQGEELLVCSYPIPPACFAALTPAELAIAEGIVEGLAPREMAKRRAVSKRTVDNQIARIYEKLGVGSRYELLALVSGAAPPR